MKVIPGDRVRVDLHDSNGCWKGQVGGRVVRITPKGKVTVDSWKWDKPRSFDLSNINYVHEV